MPTYINPFDDDFFNRKKPEYTYYFNKDKSIKTNYLNDEDMVENIDLKNEIKELTKRAIEEEKWEVAKFLIENIAE